MKTTFTWYLVGVIDGTSLELKSRGLTSTKRQELPLVRWQVREVPLRYCHTGCLTAEATVIYPDAVQVLAL